MPGKKTHSTPVNHLLIVALALSSVLLQAGSRAVTDASAVARGAWGGEHIILEVSEKGAEVEFDCAHGQISQPMLLDKHGNFDLAGTLTPEHGGPVRRDEAANPVPVRYSGHADGNSMSLKVVRKDENFGTFALTRGTHPILRKCR